MKSHIRSIIVFLAGVSLFIPTAKATHISGADIWYTYLNSNTVEVFLSRYYDCSGTATSSFIPITTPLSNGYPAAPFTSEIELIVPTGCGASFSTPWVFVSFEDVTPVCPGLDNYCVDVSSPYSGVGRAVYKRTLSLSNCNTSQPIIVKYESCCRPNSILNISNPGVNGLLIEAEIYPLVANSSPSFAADPILRYCNNSLSQIDVSGTDPDGDSLVYTLAPCYEDPPALTVTYAPGYSYSDPLGPNWTVSLDSSTGILTLDPTPGSIEISSICIGIEEYRNGALIGQTVRDFVLEGLPCGQNSSPQLDSLFAVTDAVSNGLDSIFYCPGVPFSFDIAFSDADTSQLLSLSTNLGSALPGATISKSGVNPMIATISWNGSGLNGAVLHTTITDSNCPFNDQSQYSVTLVPTGPCFETVVTQANCDDSTGFIAITPLDQNQLYTYQWSTGSPGNSISHLPPGAYWVDVFDNTLSLVHSDTFLLTSVKRIITIQEQRPACDSANGILSAMISNTVPPYSFLWNTGDTTDTIQNLSAGNYHIQITDSTGCKVQKTVTLKSPDTCQVNFSAVVFQDVDGDCQLGALDHPLANVLVDITPGGMALSDSNGVVSFSTDTGTVYLDVLSTFHTPAACSGPFIFSFSQVGTDSTLIPLPVTSPTGQDLDVSIFNGAPVVNNEITYDIATTNVGSTTVSGASQVLLYDSALQISDISPKSAIVDSVSRVITWPVSNLSPSQTDYFSIRFSINSSVLVDSSIQATARVTTILPDTDTTNNQAVIESTIGVPVPMTRKLVAPPGAGNLALIPQSTKDLEYTIRFQNSTGSLVDNVTIRDTLSAFHDLSHFIPLGSSHPYSLTIEEDSILIFQFSHLQMPDSSTSIWGSQGFVSFRVGLIPSLPPGTTVTNHATISMNLGQAKSISQTRVTIFTQPAVTLSIPSSVCLGDSLVAAITNSGKPPYTFEWSTGDSTSTPYPKDSIEIVANGWYSIRVTDSLGATAKDSIKINLLPPPDAGFIWQLTANWLEVKLKDLSQRATSYLWDFGNGDTSSVSNPLYSYSQSGTYTIKQTVINACGIDSTEQELKLGTASISQEALDAIVITQDPNGNWLTIRFPTSQQWEVEIFDLQGRLVAQERSNGTASSTISTRELSDGLYFIRIGDQQNFILKKALIRH